MFMERSKAFDSESLPAFSGLEEFSEFEDCGKLVGSVCACADATAAIADEFPEVRIEDSGSFFIESVVVSMVVSRTVSGTLDVPFLAP